MVVVFTSIFQIDKKKQQIIKEKRKENVMNFEKVILWDARESEREKESEKRMSPRGEAKQEKGTHKREKESESWERARILLSQLRERIVRERSNALSLRHTGKENNRDESDRTRARRGRRSQKINAAGGNVRIYYNYKTANKKWKNRKAVLE